jgi:hypothetical protein
MFVLGMMLVGVPGPGRPLPRTEWRRGGKMMPFQLREIEAGGQYVDHRKLLTMVNTGTWMVIMPSFRIWGQSAWGLWRWAEPA